MVFTFQFSESKTKTKEVIEDNYNRDIQHKEIIRVGRKYIFSALNGGTIVFLISYDKCVIFLMNSSLC